MARTLSTIVFLLSFSMAVPAAAQRPDPSTLTEEQRSEFADLLTRAKSAFESERYREAIEALELAYAILPEPNIHYRIGEAYELLGELEQAIDYYQRYIAASDAGRNKTLLERRVEDLQRRLAALRESVDTEPAEPAASVFLLDTNPTGASVLVDGKSPGRPTPVRVVVEPGRHTVELRLPNHQPLVREVDIAAGETISLVYPLQETATPEKPRRSPLPWIIGGAGLAGLATGGVFLAASLSAAQRVNDWDAERDAARDAGQAVPPRPAGYDRATRNEVAYRNRALVVGGVGAAALLTGAAILVFRPRAEPVSFQLGPSSVGAVVRF